LIFKKEKVYVEKKKFEKKCFTFSILENNGGQSF